jgi:glycosyltransferase involved in cell wall biosynthesis
MHPSPVEVPLKNSEKAASTPRITACIVCRNEAGKLKSCLESIQWVDEILVMDLISTDGSGETARALGARVITHPPFPYVEPLRQELAEQAQGEWVLVLDPDERVMPALEGELRRLAERDDLDAVYIGRTNLTLGHGPRHPMHRYEQQLRFYRKDRVAWPTSIHALPQVAPERTARTPLDDAHVILHDRYRTIPEAAERLERYAPAQAQDWIDQGRTFRARDMLAAMIDVVDKQLFEAGAWKEGMPGVVRAGLLVAAEFYAWAAFWEMQRKAAHRDDDRFVWWAGALARLGWIPVQWLRRLLGKQPPGFP